MNDTELAVTVFVCQFAAGFAIFFRLWRYIPALRRCLIQHQVKVETAELSRELDVPAEDDTAPMLTKAANDIKRLRAYRKALAGGSVFCSHVRSEDNFVKGNTSSDLVLPPASMDERAKGPLTLPLTLTILVTRNRGCVHMFWNAVGFALMSSSLVALIWLGETRGRDSFANHLLAELRSKLKLANDGFAFLVSFLLLGLLNYVVARWRDYHVVCQSMQAKLRDLGVAIGAAVIDGADPETRSRLFQIYRYLNVVHAMTYAAVDQKLPRAADGYPSLGLLTAAEVSVLEPLAKCAGKSIADAQREAIIGWVGGTVGAMVRGNKLHGAFSPPSHGMVNGLRAACAQYDDLRLRHMPNLWLACTHTLMVFLFSVIDLRIAFDIDPSDLTAQPRWLLLCASLTAFLAALIVTFVYLLAWAMIEELSAPFGADSDDDYNPDALLGAAERGIFASLRTSFDQPTIEAGRAVEAAGEPKKI